MVGLAVLYFSDGQSRTKRCLKRRCPGALSFTFVVLFELGGLVNRPHSGPRDFLGEFKGYLLGDCFSGNLALCAETGATFVACRAHDRRYCKKARANNKKLCDEMLGMYQELFEIERTARELQLTSEEIVQMHSQDFCAQSH